MLGLLALISAALFTGAAVYISLAEHPARLTLDDAAALAQWAPAYRRGFAMQATLAVVSGLMGLAAWWVSRDPFWAAGAILMLANWPYTLLAIRPTNHRLEATPPLQVSGETRRLLLRWGRLHAVRSGLGILATAVLLFAAQRA